MLPAEDGARETAPKVEGTLLKIFVEPVVEFWTTSVESELQVKLVATSRTGLRAECTFSAHPFPGHHAPQPRTPWSRRYSSTVQRVKAAMAA